MNIMTERQKSDLRQSILEKLVEKKAKAKQAPLTEQTAPVQQASPKGTEKYASVLREQVQKDNRNRQKVVAEKTDLLAGDESVTGAQLRQSNQELWNRVQQSLASVGGGGVGGNDVVDIVKSSEQFVEATGDSMTGDLFTPAVHITPDANDRNILYYDTLDSSHELEAKDGEKTDFDADWVTPVIRGRHDYYGLAHDDSYYYASAVTIAHKSVDGVNWSHWKTVPKGYYGKMAHNGAGTWVMVKPSGSSAAQWSTNNGASWSRTNSGTQGLTQYQDWGGLAYGNGVFVATAQSMAGSNSWNTLRYSTDGSNWNDASNLGDTIPLGNVTWSEEKQIFMVVSGRPASMHYGNSSVWTSTDGDSWQAQPAFADSDQYGLQDTAYGADEDIWVAVGYYGNIQYSINNGQFWESVNFVDDNPDFEYEDFSNVEYANGHFVARVSSGRIGAWSSDGKNWHPITSAPPMRITEMMAADGKIFAAGVSGGPQGILNGRVAFIEPQPETEGSLHFDGSLVATKTNIQPLIDIVSQLSAGAEYGLVYSDSEPSGPDSDTDVADGQMWFNSSTTNGQLLVRHNDSWSSGHSSAGNVDLSGFLPTSGGTMNGQLKMANGQILLSSTGRNINVEFGTAGRLQYSGGTRFEWGNSHVTARGTFNIRDGVNYVGDSVEGILDMHDNEIKNVPTPTATHHAATKGYVDAVGVLYQDAAPTGIADGQMWFNSSTANGQMMIRHNDSWVAI